MKILDRLLWIAYTLILIGVLWHRGINLTSPDSAEKFYFEFLYTYEPGYYWYYAAAIVQWILNCIHLAPFLLCLGNRRAFWRPIWQLLFLAMLSFNVTGHHYHIKTLQSAYQYDLVQGLFATAISIFAYIPLYFVTFSYAFIWAWRKAER